MQTGIPSVSPDTYLNLSSLVGLFGPTFLMSGNVVHRFLFSRFQLLMQQVWKDLSGFPVGPVWQIVMLNLVPLHLKGNV